MFCWYLKLYTATGITSFAPIKGSVIEFAEACKERLKYSRHVSKRFVSERSAFHNGLNVEDAREFCARRFKLASKAGKSTLSAFVPDDQHVSSAWITSPKTTVRLLNPALLSQESSFPAAWFIMRALLQLSYLVRPVFRVIDAETSKDVSAGPTLKPAWIPRRPSFNKPASVAIGSHALQQRIHSGSATQLHRTRSRSLGYIRETVTNRTGETWRLASSAKLKPSIPSLHDIARRSTTCTPSGQQRKITIGQHTPERVPRRLLQLEKGDSLPTLTRLPSFCGADIGPEESTKHVDVSGVSRDEESNTMTEPISAMSVEESTATSDVCKSGDEIDSAVQVTASHQYSVLAKADIECNSPRSADRVLLKATTFVCTDMALPAVLEPPDDKPLLKALSFANADVVSADQARPEQPQCITIGQHFASSE